MIRTFIFLVLGLFVLFPTDALAQCPFNEVNCTGLCGRFTDTNKDGYCDYSILQPQKNTPQPEQQESEGTVTADKQQHNNKPRITAKPIAENISPAPLPDEENTITAEKATKEFPLLKSEQETLQKTSLHKDIATSSIAKTQPKQPKKYLFFTVSIVTLALYTLTFILYKRKIITKQTHLRIWNVLLLLTFILSAILGLILTLQINYGFGISTFRTILRIHVEFGVSMAIIGIIHFALHLTYYKKIFNAKRSK